MIITRTPLRIVFLRRHGLTPKNILQLQPYLVTYEDFIEPETWLAMAEDMMNFLEIPFAKAVLSAKICEICVCICFQKFRCVSPNWSDVF